MFSDYFGCVCISSHIVLIDCATLGVRTGDPYIAAFCLSVSQKQQFRRADRQSQLQLPTKRESLQKITCF